MYHIWIHYNPLPFSQSFTHYLTFVTCNDCYGLRVYSQVGWYVDQIPIFPFNKGLLRDDDSSLSSGNDLSVNVAEIIQLMRIVSKF